MLESARRYLYHEARERLGPTPLWITEQETWQAVKHILWARDVLREELKWEQRKSG